jgi:hypothetical protein
MRFFDLTFVGESLTITGMDRRFGSREGDMNSPISIVRRF